MKTKFVVITALALTAAALVVTVARGGKQSQLSKAQVEELSRKEKSGKMKLYERAQLAKARGQKKVVAGNVTVLYPVAADEAELDRLLADFTVVVARPTAVKGYITDDETIRTWYKFEVLDTLSSAPPRQSFSSLAPPAALLPVRENEFLVHREGGTVRIDGVELTTPEEDMPDFRKSEPYLLVLSLNPESRVAELALGPQSFVPSSADGSVAEGQAGHILKRVLRDFHGDSVGQLKVDLRRRSGSN